MKPKKQLSVDEQEFYEFASQLQKLLKVITLKNLFILFNIPERAFYKKLDQMKKEK